MTAITLIEPGIGQWRSAAIDEDGIPTSIHFHDDPSISPYGAIFDARVSKVDSTLDMAFLDLGGERSGVMNFRRARLLAQGKATSIRDCVQEGQRLRVQVVAEPSRLDDKALAVTPRPRLTGRYVVVESGKARLNLSKDLTARQGKSIRETLGEVPEGAAVIVRSSAASVDPAIVKAEADRLTAAMIAPEGEAGLVFAWSSMEKALLTSGLDEGDIFVDGKEFADVKASAARSYPDLQNRLKPYEGTAGAFEEYGVNEALEEALADRIELPSGGWISITPCQALTAIDVNMGRALQHMSAAEAKLVVNMEATLAIAHHLRFQDIGGIIVIDYINMTGKGHSRELMALIEKSFRQDTVPVQHTGISAFGLVEVSRKRSGLSLRDRMLQTRPPVERAEGAALALLQKGLKEGKRPTPGVLILEMPASVLAWFGRHPAMKEKLAQETARQVELVPGKACEVYIRQ